MENVESVETIGASNDLEKMKMEANMEPEQFQEPMCKGKWLKSKWNWQPIIGDGSKWNYVQSMTSWAWKMTSVWTSIHWTWPMRIQPSFLFPKIQRKKTLSNTKSSCLIMWFAPNASSNGLTGQVWIFAPKMYFFQFTFQSKIFEFLVLFQLVLYSNFSFSSVGAF